MSQITKQCFIKIYIVTRKRQTTELKHKATFSTWNCIRGREPLI